MKTKSSLTADFKSVEQTPVMSHSFPREVKAREEGPFEHRVCLDRLFGSGARDKMRAPMNTTWYYVRTVQHWCHSAVLYSDNMLL